MEKDREKFLKTKANYIRDEIIRVAVANEAGHIAPSLSCVDILTALYYQVMDYNPKEPLWEERDRFILSKGHGCYGLYAILADIGVIPKKDWENFYKDKKSCLYGCVERNVKYGLEAGCGSLGHGLPMATGIALGAKLQKKKYHIFCLLGDGEMQEGTNWEALQFARKHQLNNLTIIVDWNGLQAMDFTINILDKEENDLLKKFQGFGFSPRICPGHNIAELVDCLLNTKKEKKDKPSVVLAKTIKGYGLKCMENVPKFHYRVPNAEELKKGKTYEKSI